MKGGAFKVIKGLLGPLIDLQALNLIVAGQNSNLLYPCLTHVSLTHFYLFHW